MPSTEIPSIKASHHSSSLLSETRFLFRLLNHCADRPPFLLLVTYHHVAPSFVAGTRVQDYDSQMLVAEVCAWPEGKCVGTVTRVSSQNRNGKWQVACVLTKPRQGSKRIYSHCNFDSEDVALLHAAAFELCITYHTVTEFNQWVNVKSIKSRVTTEDLVAGQDIADRMDISTKAEGCGAVTEPQAEQSVSHGAFKSAGFATIR